MPSDVFSSSTLLTSSAKIKTAIKFNEKSIACPPVGGFKVELQNSLNVPQNRMQTRLSYPQLDLPLYEMILLCHSPSDSQCRDAASSTPEETSSNFCCCSLPALSDSFWQTTERYASGRTLPTRRTQRWWRRGRACLTCCLPPEVSLPPALTVKTKALFYLLSCHLLPQSDSQWSLHPSHTFTPAGAWMSFFYPVLNFSTAWYIFVTKKYVEK